MSYFILLLLPLKKSKAKKPPKQTNSQEPLSSLNAAAARPVKSFYMQVKPIIFGLPARLKINKKAFNKNLMTKNIPPQNKGLITVLITAFIKLQKDQ